MKINQLVSGNWYNILYVNGKHRKWEGKAKFLGKASLQYKSGCVEFMCEDGVTGIFEEGDIISEIAPPSAEELDTLITKISK